MVVSLIAVVAVVVVVIAGVIASVGQKADAPRGAAARHHRRGSCSAAASAPVAGAAARPLPCAETKLPVNTQAPRPQLPRRQAVVASSPNSTVTTTAAVAVAAAAAAVAFLAAAPASGRGRDRRLGGRLEESGAEAVPRSDRHRPPTPQASHPERPRAQRRLSAHRFSARGGHAVRAV